MALHRGKHAIYGFWVLNTDSITHLRKDIAHYISISSSSHRPRIHDELHSPRPANTSQNVDFGQMLVAWSDWNFNHRFSPLSLGLAIGLWSNLDRAFVSEGDVNPFSFTVLCCEFSSFGDIYDLASVVAFASMNTFSDWPTWLLSKLLRHSFEHLVVSEQVPPFFWTYSPWT